MDDDDDDDDAFIRLAFVYLSMFKILVEIFVLHIFVQYFTSNLASLLKFIV